MKTIMLRYATSCRTCGKPLLRGDVAVYGLRGAQCVPCHQALLDRVRPIGNDSGDGEV